MALYCQEERVLSCDSCYEITKEYCEDININPGLVSGSVYYLQIVDKFGKRRTQEITINVDGSFDIDTSVLPDNYFNPHAGKFELYLSNESEGESRANLTFLDQVYSCIILSII